MIIVEHKGGLTTHDSVRTSVYGTDGKSAVKDESLIREYVLMIFINSKLSFKVVCTHTDLPELVAGRIITEAGLVPSDIEKIDICRLGNSAKVTVRSEAFSSLRKEDFTGVPTCCTDNVNLIRTDEDLRELPAADFDIPKIELIRQKAEDDTGLHRITGSSHSALLMYEDRIVFEADDIGRHNAVDKAAGYLYIRELDPSKAVIYTTGRMPTDMIRKVIRARIPVLVSRQKPTVEGVELALRYNLKLIGNLRPDSFKIYT